MSTAVVPQFTNEMLDANFRYIADQLNRHHRHIKHLEGHIVDFSKQLDDTTKATIILSKQALKRRNRKVLLVAGVVVGYYIYTRRHKIEIIFKEEAEKLNDKVSEKLNETVYTTRSESEDKQPPADDTDITL
jgi:hypothetical protein